MFEFRELLLQICCVVLTRLTKAIDRHGIHRVTEKLQNVKVSVIHILRHHQKSGHGDSMMESLVHLIESRPEDLLGHRVNREKGGSIVGNTSLAEFRDDDFTIDSNGDRGRMGGVAAIAGHVRLYLPIEKIL